MKKGEAFIYLKDHKENFENNRKCRLINPAKRESGKLSKVILDKINSNLRQKLNSNQWRNTQQVISWFGNINNKDRHSFISFEIVDFNPSISEKLLNEALTWASDSATIDHRKRYFNNKTCKKIFTFRQRQIMDKKRRKQQFI
jgi:hypothetical protein